MADIGDTNTGLPVDTDSLDKINDSLADLNKNVDSALGGIGKLTDATKKFGESEDHVKKVAPQLRKIKKDAEEAKKPIEDIRASIVKLGTGEGASGFLTGFKKAKEDGLKQLDGLLTGINRFVKMSNSNVSGLGDTFNALAIQMAASGKKMAVDKAFKSTHLDELEKRVTTIAKVVQQAGVSFTGFTTATKDSSGAAGQFATKAKTLVDSIANAKNVFKATDDVAADVGKTLATGMGAQNAALAVADLSDATGKLSQRLSTVETAIGIATATGMSHTKITDAMVTAYQELGETVAGSAKMFGVIQGAAKESGIGFSKTHDAIMSGAKAMKFWGGTVESVTPIYNAFAKSLEKGRKGLAPELFQGVVSGIEKMNFETRALLGLRTVGGGGGVGALQAGFKMEQALQEGPEGMKKVMGSVMDMLKQFGGGRITTLKEAAGSPEAARNFAVQRQLLGKMIGITGASANKTLDMLSKIQDSNMDINSNQAGNFQELIQAGKTTADKTTTEADSAAAQESASFDKLAETIKGEAKTMLTGTGFQTGIDSLNRALTKSISTGNIDLRAIRDGIRAMRGKPPIRERQPKQTANQVMDRLSAGKPIEQPKRVDIATGFNPIIEKVDQLLNAGKKTPADEGLNTNQIIPPPPLPPPPPETDRLGLSMKRAMDQYRQLRAEDQMRRTPPMAAAAIDQAARAAPNRALADINVDEAAEAVRAQAATAPTTVAPTIMDTTRGAGTTKQPEEIEVKIKVHLDKNTIKLDTSMIEDVIRLRANA